MLFHDPTQLSTSLCVSANLIIFEVNLFISFLPKYQRSLSATNRHTKFGPIPNFIALIHHKYSLHTYKIGTIIGLPTTYKMVIVVSTRLSIRFDCLNVILITWKEINWHYNIDVNVLLHTEHMYHVPKIWQRHVDIAIKIQADFTEFP